MPYLLLFLVVAVTVYIGWRLTRSPHTHHAPPPRVIGPDDDPEFLFRIDRDRKKPR